MAAVLHFCTFYVDKLWFGLKVESVQEVVSAPKITPVPLAPSAVAGLVNLRGQIVPLINLRQRLQFGQAAVTPSAMIVVRNQDSLMGLLVGEIGEVVEAPESGIETGLQPIELRGLVPVLYQLPGRLLHVLDLEQILRPGGKEVQSDNALK